MSNMDELKNRIEAKKHDVKKEIAELKADSSAEKRNRIESLQKKLDELDEHLRSGWEDLSDAVAGKLKAWLEDDAAK